MTPATAASLPALSLAGPWKVRLDEDDEGLAAEWFASPLAPQAAAVALPGSLVASGLGHPFDPATGRYAGARRPFLAWPSAGYTEETRADELGALVPARIFLGPAWYERTVEIPPAPAAARWLLTLERVKWTSRLWIDGEEVEGENTDSLHAPHRYRTPPLAPGPHRITLRIDNRPPLNIGLAGHGYGMETEPIWNGVAGDMRLEPIGTLWLESLRIHPHPEGRLRIDAVGHGIPHSAASIEAEIKTPDGATLPLSGNTAPLAFSETSTKSPTPFSATLAATLPGPPEPWDEFHPALYQLTISLHPGDGSPPVVRTLRIGFRTLRRDKARLLLNGAPLFLRGNLDCAIHPESDTPPTDRAWWQRVLGIHKAAGFNHIRFHTWCPPEVAFQVADELGLYLQVETAFWVDNWIHETPPFPPRLGEDPAVDAWVLAESKRIICAYAHHPSFLFFCLGNEFGMDSDWTAIDRIVAELRRESDTLLVSGTTARKSVPHDEFWVTHATPKGNVRTLEAPHTDWDFSAALAGTEVPAISHETGQRQCWPDYQKLIAAFPPAAPVQPHNLTRLLARAEAAGVADHPARAEATARFAALLYKAEHEAMRRTAALSGYQLLMLHDFTGQGEAFVGLLDPFFREKPGVSLDDIRAWNAPTTPLARFARYTWTSTESFRATLQLAHQGPGPLADAQAEWSLIDITHNKTIASGTLPSANIPAGALADLGAVEAPLAEVAAPARLDFVVTVAGHRNSWPLWVYPPADSESPAPDGIHIARRLDDEALSALERGESVLLLFHNAGGLRFRQTRWESTFWTGAWGWGHGLGLMCPPRHPALTAFPNSGHSDWQWRDLAEGGTAIRLDARHAPASIVEHISTFHQPAHESFLAELQVGNGRLLACGFDIEHDLATRHAARALRHSLLAYLQSDLPPAPLALDPAEAAALFDIPAPLDATARADSETPGHEAARVLDGDPTTYWQTSRGAIEPPHPHELVIELARPAPLRAVRLKARADSEDGRIAELSLFLAERAGDWGSPVLSRAPLENTADWQQLDFPAQPARFLRLLTHREVHNRPFASLAELEIIEEN